MLYQLSYTRIRVASLESRDSGSFAYSKHSLETRNSSRSTTWWGQDSNLRRAEPGRFTVCCH